MRLSAFETFCLFMALRNHFTVKSYDYFKYQGKVKMTIEGFAIRKDRFHYQKLSRKYDEKEIKDFLIANFMNGKKWVGEFLDDDADDIYKQYLRRKQALSKIIKDELDKLPNNMFDGSSIEYPPLVSAYLSADVSLETLCVLEDFVGFVTKFDERLDKDDVLWPKIRQLIIKARPFIEYDKTRLKKILKQRFFPA